MSSQTRPWTLSCVLCLLIVASAICNSTLKDVMDTMRAAKRLRKTPRWTHAEPMEAHSWIGNDYPELFPVDAGPIKLLVEDSVHYSLTDREAYEEWLWTAPLVGDNHVRLGPEKRMFAVPMFHQLHCLRSIRSALEDGWSTLPPVHQGHIHHCFNYLRQWTLCSADVTLAPGDFATRNWTTERTGGVHTCLDWKPVYRAVEQNWLEWEEFRDKHGLSEVHAT